MTSHMTHEKIALKFRKKVGHGKKEEEVMTNFIEKKETNSAWYQVALKRSEFGKTLRPFH